jgi:hypothetical protein
MYIHAPGCIQIKTGFYSVWTSPGYRRIAESVRPVTWSEN